jgi:hypothetical protein
MNSLILFTALILSITINAQIIEGVSFLGLNQYPHTSLKMSGFGSRGFDDEVGIYNQDFSAKDSLCVISVSGISNLPILRTMKLNNEKIALLDNKLDFLPQASIRLMLSEYKNFAITINYFSDVLSSVKFGDRSGSASFRFLTENGTYEVLVDMEKSKFYSKNKILQFYLSYLLNNNTSFSLGVQTTAFDYVYDWAPLKPITFKNDLFNKAQIIASINHQFNNDIYSYLTFKSQKSNILLTKDAYHNGEEILTQNSYLSLHGNIGYGIRYQISDRVSVSAEMSHQFLEVDTLVDFKYYIEPVVHHVWNNELILGTKVRVLEELYVGLMLSYYMRYNNDIYIWFSSETSPFEGTEVMPSNPLTLIASLKYQLSNYRVILQYQHSRTSYINHGTYGNDEMYDYGNFFKLTLSANFSALSDFGL